MLQNYFKIAVRNILKHRFFAFLNITGLAIGMSSCLTVILIIRDQLSYDHFHSNRDSIYRIICQQEDGMRLASVPYPLGETLSRDFSVVTANTRLIRSIQGTDATTAEHLTLPISGFFAEPSFFNVFGFQLMAGNAATALSEPNTIVLSQQTAARFFGAANPIGQTLTLKNKGMYTVTGVVAAPTGKTHLDFDCLASVCSMVAIEAAYQPDEFMEKVLDNWENRFASYVYVQLAPGKSQADLTQALDIVAKNRTGAGKSDKNVQFFAQNLNDISPRAEQLANDIGGAAPWFMIWGMCAFVLILTIFPCLNYANLAVSRALTRTKEMGVRKAIGAGSADVKRLVLVEAMTTSVFALGLAWLIHLPLNYFVETYFPPQARLTNLHADGYDWGIFIVFSLIVGLLAGWLPARRLARLQPALALRGNSSGATAPASRLGWRTAMLVGQFTMSLVIMIVVATLWSQIRYMTLADYGFQKENLLTIQLQGNKAAVVAAEIMQDPHITGACMTSVQVAGSNLQGIPLHRERGGEDLGIHCASVDENYIPVMGLQLIAGTNFHKSTANSKEEWLIINEKALARFQLGSPAQAVGKVLWMNDSMPVTVQGVIKDFNYRIFEHGIEPFALRYAPTENGYIMHARLAPGDPAVAMASLESIWKKIDIIHPFKAEFMEESVKKAYNHVTFVGGLASFFALLALSLACMGLLGMVTYTVGTKVKEIGIRKVLGASVSEVTILLSRHFLILMGIAVAIALPAGYFLSNIFLELFVYRIAVGATILGYSTLVLLGLGLLTIGFQVVKAALANPVQSLRSE